jgi:hypothetical protein
MPRPGVTVTIVGSGLRPRPLPPEPEPPEPPVEPEPEPIPDPVADFFFTPSQPTTDDPITVDGSLSTPAEHIDRYSFARDMPDPTNTYDQPWDMGPMPAGPCVVTLIVRLEDGRSARRQRGVTVVAAPTHREPF